MSTISTNPEITPAANPEITPAATRRSPRTTC